jgi:hypothetical protein
MRQNRIDSLRAVATIAHRSSCVCLGHRRERATIAGGLITAGSGCSLPAAVITLRTRLVSLREGPIAISHRLITLHRLRNRSDALLLSVGRPVGGIHGITA